MQNKEVLNITKSLCFMGKQKTFHQFMDIKEKEFGQRNNFLNVDFLRFIPSHDTCSHSIGDMFSEINRKSKRNVQCPGFKSSKTLYETNSDQ